MQKVRETETLDTMRVDKGLVALFLKMSPLARVQANDNAARTILELRNAFRKRKTFERQSGQDS